MSGVLAPEYANAALDAIRSLPGGDAAATIDGIRETPAGTLVASSPYGGVRVVDMLVGDPLPRIC